ncbi:MAG: hypothetical protein ED859_15190 [Desulfuromonadales bacterium]|nr:MAG: hypothetical protein ED859_15190 [Desulfuromonadales bacterium]
MWEKVTAISTLISVIISVVAIVVAVIGTRTSSKIATEALETARQANDISLGRLKEPPAVEIVSVTAQELDFTDPKVLSEDLKTIIQVRNIGKVPIDGLSVELIGISPLTYPIDNFSQVVRPLPSVLKDISLKTILQPEALANIDLRLLVLLYLEELDKQIQDKQLTFHSTINIVLHPKAIGDTLPSGVLSAITKKDRVIIKIRFKEAILSSDKAIELLKSKNVFHRVYAP